MKQVLLSALIIITGIINNQLRGQECVDEYFSVNYRTATVQEPTSAIQTSDGQILLAGSVLRQNSILKDGWLTKFSSKGTILWSRRYPTFGTAFGYNYVRFSKVVEAENGNVIALGNIAEVDTTTLPLPTPIRQYGMVVKVDKFGTLLWSKIITGDFIRELFSDAFSVIKTIDGDFVFTLGYYRFNTQAIVVRIDTDGNVKWATSLLGKQTRTLFFGNISLTETRSGSIIVGSTISAGSDSSDYDVTNGWYSASIAAGSGLVNWERMYVRTDPNLAKGGSYGDVAAISEQADGSLNMIASYAEIPDITTRRTKQVLKFTTNSNGILQKVLSYQYTPKVSLYASAASAIGSSGEYSVMMDNADSISMMYLESNGQVRWQKRYWSFSRGQESRALINTANGYYLFSYTRNGGSRDLNLVKTDPSGNIECVEHPEAIYTEDGTTLFTQRPPVLIHDPVTIRLVDGTSLYTNPYTMVRNDLCRKDCCSDVTDTASVVNLCNQSSYSLPNNYKITSSGIYNVILKTSKGCDSIVFYTVNFYQDPVVNLGPDKCMNGLDSIVIKTAEGYENYRWINTNSPNSFYVVRSPGTYYVTINNYCGSKSDSVRIYEECSFEIFMPSAFTPNSDNLNDVFKVPELNKNQLVKLTIYSRWGQVIFETTDPKKGWDGKVNMLEQATGNYPYILQMKGLDGKLIRHKGIVKLMR